MDRIYLFTWNLHGSTEAYNLAVDHLARRGIDGPFIACLQELPKNSSIARLRTATTHGFGASATATEGKAALEDLDARGIKVVSTPSLARGLALVHHPDLTIQSNPVADVDDEFVAAVFQMPLSRSKVRVVGLHAKSKVDMQHIVDHGGSRALLRQAINELRLEGDHTILLGDFNSAVGDREVKSWHCFYVISPTGTPHTNRALAQRRGVSHPALYAVMPNNSNGMGTFQQRDTGSDEHQLIDFIAVDRDIFEGARSKILTEVSAQLVWDPMKNCAIYGDHLPVEGTVDIKGEV